MLQTVTRVDPEAREVGENEMDDTHIFSILDHVLFFGLLTISTIIGLVSAFKGNRSPEEFFLGNRSLNPVAVSMSLLTSFISATNLSVTTEVYLHGSQLSLMSIGCISDFIFIICCCPDFVSIDADKPMSR
ncbi:Sodium-coupled monocarboxylate transporter 1, partial [Armadillidium vulgare]